MNPDVNPKNALPTMVLLAAFVIIIAGMKAAATILVPFLLSAFIAIVVSPLMFWLRRKGASVAVALAMVITALVVVILLLSGLIGSSVTRFTQDLPAYQTQLETTISVLQQWLERIGIDASDIGFSKMLDPSAVMGIVGTSLNGLAQVLKNGFLILMTVSFMLVEAFNLPDKLRAVTGEESAYLNYQEFLETVNRYVAIKAAISLITGLVITVFLSIMGIDYAILWGFLAFFLNFVPNIGSFIAAIPAVLLAIAQMGLGHAALVAGGYVIVNLIIGNLIEPRFMGRGLGLSLLTVFLSLGFWGWVLGPVGMLLSIPLTIMVKIALESSPRTQKIAIFLGPQVTPAVQSAEVPKTSPR